jgi:hypothetical protein
VTKFKVL